MTSWKLIPRLKRQTPLPGGSLSVAWPMAATEAHHRQHSRHPSPKRRRWWRPLWKSKSQGRRNGPMDGNFMKDSCHSAAEFTLRCTIRGVAYEGDCHFRHEGGNGISELTLRTTEFSIRVGQRRLRCAVLVTMEPKNAFHILDNEQHEVEAIGIARQVLVVCVARLSRSSGSDGNQTWNYLERRIHPQFRIANPTSARLQFTKKLSCPLEGELLPIDERYNVRSG